MVFAPFGKIKGKETFLSVQDYKNRFDEFRWSEENRRLSVAEAREKWFSMPTHLGTKRYALVQERQKRSFSKMIAAAQDQASRTRAEEIKKAEQRHGMRPRKTK